MLEFHKIIVINNNSNKIGKNKLLFHNFSCNIILFYLILLLLPKNAFLADQHIIYIRVNKIGFNQILSNEYSGELPLKIFINGKLTYLNNKKIYINSTNYEIGLEWDNALSNFSFMFSNLPNIIYVKSYNISGYFSNMTYMFKNCFNLKYYEYIEDYNSHSIIDMSGMFYNCLSLRIFKFDNLNLIGQFSDVHNNIYYNGVNVSYMFFNCQNLIFVIFYNAHVFHINSAKGMFYNCTSLMFINLFSIQTNNYIDTSYMFHNCNNLGSIYYYNLKVSNMSFMFYNCTSLDEIDLDCFLINSDVNMSYTFYNCTSLSNIQGNFNNFKISDTREMFYNCISLNNINFSPFQTSTNINMSKMFYNCRNIKSIIFNIYNNNVNPYSQRFIFPNDLSSTFYNCTSLINIYFYYLKTDNTQDISYMFYNCKSLKNSNINETLFSNILTKNMRGTFQNCKSLENLNLHYFYTSNAEIMWDMFKGCSRLVSLNIDNFNTSKVTDMESMFEGCSSLISLSLKNFRTEKVHYMNRMFRDCTSLKSINFKYISSENLGTMHQMFYNCKSLEYVNIYSLTEREQSIVDIFALTSNHFTLCIKENENITNILKEILNKPHVKRDCSNNCYEKNRTYAPESKFCCPNFVHKGICVEKCPSRTRDINEDNICKDFECTNYYDYDQNNCIDIIEDGFYINDTKLKTIDKCHKDCKTCNESAKGNNSNCLTCKDENYYLYLGNCYNDCKNGYNPITKECNCFLEECSNCSRESDEKGLCIECSEGYYSIYNDITNIQFKKCYKETPENYYFDEESSTYKKCYESCSSCHSAGNSTHHNCIVCLGEYTYEIQKNDSKNCHKKCSDYFFFDNYGNYHCVEKCKYPFYLLIDELNQCIKSCSQSNGYYKEFQGKCYKECPKDISIEINNKTERCKPICTPEFPYEIVDTQSCVSSCNENQKKYKICVDNYFANITNIQDSNEKTIIEQIINSFNENNTHIFVEQNGTKYELLPLNSQNEYNTSSEVDLLDCENELINYYKIKENETLYILKIDVDIKGKTGPTILYQVYYEKAGTNKLEQLDLTLCEGMRIKTSFFKDLENPELYDINNPIYNSICYPYSSKSGVDMTIKDIRDDFTENEKMLCNENCAYDYDDINKKVNCDCETLINLPYIADIKINKKKLYKFMNIEKIGNLDVLKCVNLVFSKEGLRENIGFYFFLLTIIMYIICIYIFYKNDFKLIRKYIKDLIFAKKYIKYLDLKEKMNINNGLIKSKSPLLFKIIDKKNIKISDRLLHQRKSNQISLTLINTLLNNKINYNYLETNANNNIKKNDNSTDRNINNASNNPPKKYDIYKNKQLQKKPRAQNQKKNNKLFLKHKLNTNKITVSNKFSKKSIIDKILFAKKQRHRIIEIMKPNDAEMNDYEYKEAIKYDNRNFYQYYLSLLKTEQMILKIINKNDYNSRVIKVYLFFLDLDLSLVVNALFFNDETMHKILEDGGKFNLIYQLPQIIYSTIISIIFGSFFSYFGLSEDKILEFKKEKIKESLIEKKGENLIKELYYQFLNFFIFSFLIVLMFWYYIAAFCAVYKNTQYHLIKDTLISLATSFFTPFLIKLSPVIFRIPSLKYRKKIMFGFSKILQIF